MIPPGSALARPTRGPFRHQDDIVNVAISALTDVRHWGKLQQVTLNVLSNAGKFTAPGGWITVDTPGRISSRAMARPIGCAYGVLDMGIGRPRAGDMSKDDELALVLLRRDEDVAIADVKVYFAAEAEGARNVDARLDRTRSARQEHPLIAALDRVEVGAGAVKLALVDGVTGPA